MHRRWVGAIPLTILLLSPIAARGNAPAATPEYVQFASEAIAAELAALGVPVDRIERYRAMLHGAPISGFSATAFLQRIQAELEAEAPASAGAGAAADDSRPNDAGDEAAAASDDQTDCGDAASPDLSTVEALAAAFEAQVKAEAGAR